MAELPRDILVWILIISVDGVVLPIPANAAMDTTTGDPGAVPGNNNAHSQGNQKADNRTKGQKEKGQTSPQRTRKWARLRHWRPAVSAGIFHKKRNEERATKRAPFRTAEEEPKNIAAAVEAAKKSSINDSLQEDDDPTDAENFDLGLDALPDELPLEDLPSTFLDDITNHMYSSDEEENDEERGVLLDLVRAGEYVVV
ncbi:MAG: hypothetical protein LQ345_006908 [Seirophora villosa]|nr:MAG: hypothetical protein LQ345_006908 [Seirophora villosa]